MIQSIKSTNHLGESLTMVLKSPEQSGLIVVMADGLGSPEADISLSERAGLDGSSYNSARAESRNVVLKLRFMLGQSVEVNRQKTYKYFPLKRKIRLEIVTDTKTVYAEGYVESNKANIFSDEAGCIISIMFPDSYLYNEFQQETIFSSVTGSFEFPFSNESLVTPLIEFGDISTETEKKIIYEGDAPVGILLHVHANGAATGLVITNSITLETLAIDSTKLAATTGSDISEGDDFYISTVKGNKYAKLIRGVTEYNILNCLGTSPTWFQLEKGDNIFAYTATSGLSNLEYEIINDVAYEGI